MRSPSPPPVPDPVATAEAQGKANLESARQGATLSRYDQFTPFGNMTWSNEGDKWASTITLDPRVQALLDSSMSTSLGLDATTQQALERVQQVLGGGIDYGGLPAFGDYNSALANATNRVGSGVTLRTDPGLSLDSGLGGNTTQLNDVSRQMSGQQELVSGAQSVASTFGRRMLDGLNTPMPESNVRTRQAVENALFERLMSRIAPEYAQREATTRSMLMNRGITEGSQAWNTELDMLGRSRNDAISNAARDAIGMGGQEQTRLLGNELAVRDQYGQEAGQAASLLSGVIGGLGNLGSTQLNQYGARTTQQNADLSVFNSENAARLSDFNAFNSASQAQQGLDMDELRLADALAGNEFSMRNQGRANVLAELLQARGLSLNELASLRSGQQVQMPNFNSVNTAANVNAAPIAQSIWNAYQGQLNQYNTDVGSNNALLMALAQIGGSAMMMR